MTGEYKDLTIEELDKILKILESTNKELEKIEGEENE